MNDIGLIFKALEFASMRHKRQFRKGEDHSPYINHPIQVASLLANEGGENDTALLTSAILHDVIEDTVNSPQEKQILIDEIKENFGDEILSITLEVTDDRELDKQIRKQLQIDEAPHKSDKAKKVKLADKIMNVRDIIDNPPEDWGSDRKIEYVTWAEKVVDGLRGVNKTLEDLFDELLQEAKGKLNI